MHETGPVTVGYKMKKTLLRLTVAFLVSAACQPLVSTPSSQVPRSPTPLDEAFPERLETFDPTIPPSPIMTVTASEPAADMIELPEWVRSPSKEILFLTYQDDPTKRPSKAIFVNPDTGERNVVDLSDEYYFYYWTDAGHLIFFHGKNCDTLPEFITDLDVATGALQKYVAMDYPEYVRDCYRSASSENELTRINMELDERTVELIDPSTGTTSLLTNPDDGVTDISHTVSPGGNYVAVVQHRGNFEMPEMWEPVYGNQISIYDLATQKLVLQFAEEQRILSEVSFVNYNNLVYMRENTPCLVMISSLSKKCIHNIPQRFPGATVILSEPLDSLGWIGFLYFSVDSQHQGGYCFYDIYTGGLGCPTDRFPGLEGQVVTNHSLSPDEHYLLIEYDRQGCPMPWCDNFDNPQLAVIDLNEAQFFEIGPSDTLSATDSSRPKQPNPWRPCGQVICP